MTESLDLFDLPLRSPDPISEYELEQCIRHMSNRKAPGYDSICPGILKMGLRCIGPRLVNLLNACLVIGHFPSVWKKGVLVLIPKPDSKTDSVKSVRPITLLPVLGKLLEGIAIKRVNKNLYAEQRMSSIQFGFVPQRSTTDALCGAVEMTERFVGRGGVTILLSLDIKGAFDNAPWGKIIAALCRMNVDRGLIKLFAGYFENREISLTLGQHTSSTVLTGGCAQGSRCGPGLWNILMNDLLTKLHDVFECETYAYADDVLILVHSPSPFHAGRRLQKAVAVAENWAKSTGMEFNAKKSALMLLTKRKKITAPRIMLNDQALRYVNLRVLLTNRYSKKGLSWLRHAEFAANKARRALAMICRISRNTWGLGGRDTAVLCGGMVESIVLYATPALKSMLQKKTSLGKLESVRRLADVRSCGAYRTVRRETVLWLAGMSSLTETISLKEKIFRQRKNPSNIEGIEVEGEDDWFGTVPLHLPLQPTHGARTERASIETKLHQRFKKVAFCIKSGQNLVYLSSFETNRQCTVVQCEAIAIGRILDFVRERDLARILVKIEVSKKTFEKLHDTDVKMSLVNAIRTKINQSALNYPLELSVKDDSQIDSSTACLLTHEYGTPTYNKIPIWTAKKKLKRIWLSRRAPPLKGCAAECGFSRPARVLPDFYTSQFITGHGNFESFLSKIYRRESESCSLCGAPTQDRDHLLFQCPTTHCAAADVLDLGVGCPGDLWKVLASGESHAVFSAVCKSIWLLVRFGSSSIRPDQTETTAGEHGQTQETSPGHGAH